MDIRWRPRRKAIPRDAIAAAAVVRKGKPGGEGFLMVKRTKTNCKNGDETEMCLRERKDRERRAAC
jgi:hypothetical protein